MSSAVLGTTGIHVQKQTGVRAHYRLVCAQTSFSLPSRLLTLHCPLLQLDHG